MRLLNQDTDVSVKNILILLNRHEAAEMRDALAFLLSDDKKNNHVHLDDESFTHEITLSIYDVNTANGLQPRILTLIQTDE